MRNDQLIRQWEILWSLVGPPGRTVKAMTEEYEVSERTILRDLEALESAGYPRWMRGTPDCEMTRSAGALHWGSTSCRPSR